MLIYQNSIAQCVITGICLNAALAAGSEPQSLTYVDASFLRTYGWYQGPDGLNDEYGWFQMDTRGDELNNIDNMLGVAGWPQEHFSCVAWQVSEQCWHRSILYKLYYFHLPSFSRNAHIQTEQYLIFSSLSYPKTGFPKPL